MEGKEVRFGLANSVLFTTVTTDTSDGAVNDMHDSLLRLAGMVPMVNIMLGEVIFGGVGSGLYGMLLFVIVAMFVAGLMVGRTPEYLGKKLEAKEVKMAMLAILILPLSILGFTALAVVLPVGTGAMNNAGPHGFSEALYAYVSATGNNGSAFAGISANVPFYNTTQGVAMFIGRFLMIIPMLAIAGSLARKDRADLRGNVSHRQSAVRRPGRRRDRNHRRTDRLPGGFPRAGRGALRHARWHRLRYRQRREGRGLRRQLPGAGCMIVNKRSNPGAVVGVQAIRVWDDQLRFGGHSVGFWFATAARRGALGRPPLQPRSEILMAWRIRISMNSSRQTGR